MSNSAAGPDPFWDHKQGVGETEGDITLMKTTRRNIVKNIRGERYLLTSRRLVELDSKDARKGQPWYALNKNIRAAASFLPVTVINVSAKEPMNFNGLSTVEVHFGQEEDINHLCYRIGCASFDFKTFERILRNAGVQGTQKKAFAAKAGA